MIDKNIQGSLNKKNIAILGCGISGLTLAQILSNKNDAKITLFDSYKSLGGNHISIGISNFTFDIGTFVFSDKGDFFKHFKSIENFYIEVQPKFGRITPKGELDIYPFSVSNYYKQSSFHSFLLDVIDLMVCKLIYFRKRDVPSYSKYYLGERIYKKSGLKNYIERFYGIKDVEIDLDFALKRMAMIGDVASIRRNIFKFFNRNGAKTESKERIFIRPKEGFYPIYKSLQEQMEAKGIEFRLGKSIDSIVKSENLFTINYNDNNESFDKIITTIPLNDTLNYIKGNQTFKLPLHKLISLFISFDGKLNFDDHVLYNFMDKGEWKRLTVYSRFYGKVDNCEYFTIEVPSDTENIPNVKKIYENSISFLFEQKIIEGKATLLGWNLLENAYPVYKKKDGDNIKLVKK